MSLFVNNLMNYFGRACRNRTYTVGFEDRNDIHFTKARSIFIGPAYRNRTHIHGVEDRCIIHYTKAGKLVLLERIELSLPPYQRGVLPFNYKSLVPLPRLERGTHSF